jgi:hypothetical protein
MQPKPFLVATLAVLIGIAMGVAVTEFKHAPTNEVKAPVIDPAPIALVEQCQDLASECQAMLTKAQDIATECYGSVDMLFKITNKLTDIAWDWSWAELKELRKTPKPEPLTKTTSDSPGQIIMVPQ